MVNSDQLQPIPDVFSPWGQPQASWPLVWAPLWLGKYFSRKGVIAPKKTAVPVQPTGCDFFLILCFYHRPILSSQISLTLLFIL